MRLLMRKSSTEFSLTKDLTDSDDIPPYTILSHTWGDDSEEVTFTDIEKRQGQQKEGYKKLKFCGEQARKDGYQYFWVDTCCINKDSHTELSEAITSMFKWYQNAGKCYVYLSDVSSSGTALACQLEFRTSRWFTRGWTLQELLAPSIVEFFSRDEELLGTKRTLTQQIHEITTIPIAALDGSPFSEFSITERIRWTENRRTKRKEDKAYCLLGIFNIYMTFNYGEGENALRRLQRKINNQYGADVANALVKVPPTWALGLCLNSAPTIQPDNFVGRTAEIEAISNALRPDEVPTEQRRVVLGGMGGIGKTQLAIAYARRYESSYASVMWLNATSESTLYMSFRSIARGFISAEELEKLDDKQLSARCHEWLSDRQNAQWLLIFDNHDEPDEFDIDSFCPNIGHGSIIVTTRLPDKVTGQQVRVQPLQEIDHSLDILQVRSGRGHVEKDVGARRLAQRLGGLPLALVTAGAYLRRSTITFQQYLDAYEQCWQVDRRRPLCLPEYQDRTLYTTWNLSYARLENDDPEAAQILRLLAYFDNQDIWYELLSAGSPERLPAALWQSFSDRMDFENTITTLVDYCFLEVQITTQSYSMHSYVHDWTLAGLNKNLDQQLYWYAFDCVAASIDHSDLDALSYRYYGRLAPHAAHLLHPWFLRDKSLNDIESDRLNDTIYIAKLLTGQVRLSKAEQMYLRALAGYEAALGPDHISTLNTVNNLGILYWNQGKQDKAEQMYLRALAGYETALGPDHTSTLDLVNNLGILYNVQGKLDRAEQMYLRALAGTETALGPDHPSTLSTVNNLGLLHWKQGKLDTAEQMCLRALAGYETALGPDHISTLSTVNNLGDLSSDQGKLDKAEQMYLRALAGRETALGPEHPSTLDTVNNLGVLYKAQGKLDTAEQMCLRALAGTETALGPDHPSTLDIVNNLGDLYSDQGKLDAAEQMYLRALAGYETFLGPDRISTLSTVNNLGNLYSDQGKLDEAKQMYLRALARYEAVLGVEHLSTPNTIDQLSLFHSTQSQVKEAIQVYERSLKACAEFVQQGKFTANYIRGYSTSLRLCIWARCSDYPWQVLQLYMLAKQWSDDTYLFAELARAMIYCNDERNAAEAYRHAVRYVDHQRSDYGGIYCDGCQREITVTMGLHVCRVCVETDLCDQCILNHSSDTNNAMTLTRCADHPFFHVGTATSVNGGMSPRNGAWIETWINRALAEYSAAEKMSLRISR